MVDITVNVRIENQEKLQSLLRGLDVTTLACKEEHFAEFKDLVDGEMYQPGKPFTRPGRGRRLSGLRTARPTKKQKVQPHHARGPLSDRAQDKKRAQNESLFAEAEPYKDTIWLRARGHMVPMSMDKYHLQRRFERLHDKIDELKEVNAEQEEQLSTISEHEAAAKKREDKLTKKIDALEADISQLMEDVSDEENEVTFKSEGEYDPAFVLCMMFALAFTSYRIAFDIIKFVFETLTGKKMTDHQRSEQQQKTIIRTQLTSWQQCDLWKPPKGFSVSKTSLRDFKTTIAGLIEGRFSAAASSSSSSSSSRAAADDSDDVDDIVHESGIQSDEDLVGDSMPCCGVVYAENGGYRVVSCSRCARWFHVGSLGKCKGDSNMLQCSDEPLSAFLCSGCSA
jgi:hypothetical protein